MARTPSEMLQGTVDILILRTLAWEPMHGYAISRWIDDANRRRAVVDGAALYQALHRLERRKWVAPIVGRLRKQPQGEVLHAHDGGRTSCAPNRPCGRMYADAVGQSCCSPH